MQLSQGTLLHGGTYKIVKMLGQGSFGITYLAEHTSLGKKVAIKEFFMKELNSRSEDGSITGMSDGSLSYNYAQKFKKEAINLSRLEHPNIVRVTDSFDENGTYYYVMNYIDGENLNDYIKHNYIDQNEAVSIINEVALALLYMHEEKHMLHLDLKPGNIMRRASDGHIFLIDFGLSKHYDSKGAPETSTTIGLGTAGYAPVEQANQAKNGEFRPTIDVYALGATLFKLLTRETPPAASELISDDELIESKLRANGISGNIVNLIVNAMMPNVRKRTQTISAFLSELTDTPMEQVCNNSVHENTYLNQHTPKIEDISEETVIKPTLNTQKNYNNKSELKGIEPRTKEDILSKHLLWFPLLTVITLVIAFVVCGIFYWNIDTESIINSTDDYFVNAFIQTIGFSIASFISGYIGGKYYPTNKDNYSKWYFALSAFMALEVPTLLIPDEDPLYVTPEMDMAIGLFEAIIICYIAIWGAKLAISKKKGNNNSYVTSFFEKPFSLSGRIRRSEYLYSLIIYYVIYLEAVKYNIYLINCGWSDSSNSAFLWLIPAMWFIIAQGTKRCHDLGHNGWWQLIPFYGIAMMFSGSDSENDYGENPKGE